MSKKKESAERVFPEKVKVRRHIDETMLRMLAGQKDTVDREMTRLTGSIEKLTEKIGNLDVACGDRRAVIRSDFDTKLSSVREEVIEQERRSLSRFNKLMLGILLAVVAASLGLARDYLRKKPPNPVLTEMKKVEQMKSKAP